MGHTPISESKNLEILSFEESRSRKNSSLNYNREKWIYIPDLYTDYRYILGINGDKTIVTIGINPSTAEPDSLDNTIKSVERIALKNGFDSYIMCNVYAQRSTEPSRMDKCFNRMLHQENINAIRWLFEQIKETPIIWAAWGASIERRKYLKNCLNDIVELSKEFNAKWVSAGELKKGHPHHPLYLKKNTCFIDFDVDRYIDDLKNYNNKK